MKQKVLLEIEHQIATLVLNRPEIGNAFDNDVINILTHHLQTLADDNDVRALILRGAGKHFSSGADLNWMQSMASYSREENLEDAKVLANMLRLLNDFPKPTLACIQGAAFGGAVGLTACCDIALATPHAKFCLSEVKLGLIPAVISPYVIAAIGQRNARRLMLTAEVIEAPLAQKINLVHEIIQDESLMIEKAEDLAKALLKNGPKAIQACKKLIMNVERCADAKVQDDYTATIISDLRVSAEGQEGLNAFLEKRAPDWKNA